MGCHRPRLWSFLEKRYGPHLGGDKKVLKPGGPCIEVVLCNPVEMLEKFDSYFIKHFHIGEVNRVEGQLHSGTAHVVQSMFQKREEE